MNADFAAAASSWLAMNDPVQGATLSRYYESLSPRGLESTGKTTSGVVSNATLIGSDRDRVLNASKELKNLLNKPEGVNHFRSNPMDGCTSVMNMARVASGFNPALMAEPGAGEAEQLRNVRTYNDYISRLMSAPFFNFEFNDKKNLVEAKSDWNALVDSISDLFEGVMAEDKASIRKGLVALIKAATSRVRTEQRQYLFTQSVLRAGTSGSSLDYNVNIYSSEVVMIADEGKGGTSTQASYQVLRTKLTFRSDEWPNWADRVWAKQVTTVDDWLDGNSTPADPAYNKKLCIEKPVTRGATS